MPISAADISIVFQGPVSGASPAGNAAGLTAEAVASARRAYPDAEIVLSTWRDTDVSGIECDRVVFSDDPGGVKRADGRMNNVNRQIRSTLNGLRAATRSYAIKVRTDTVFTHAGAAELAGRYPQRAAAHRYFAERVIACEWFFRNPRRCPLLFHMGDIFQLGLTSDLVDLWDLPFEPAEHTQAWDLHFPRHSRFRWRMFTVPFRYCEEQYIWTSFLRKKGCDVALDYPWQVAVPLTVASELSLINNFVIASAADIGIRLPDRLTKYSNFSTYSPDEWLDLYDHYCVAAETASCDAVARYVQAAVISRQVRYVIHLPRRAWHRLLALRKKKTLPDARP